MTRRPEDSSPRELAMRAYRALLVLYPSEFRAEYGAHMTQVFRDQCRRRRGKLRGIASWWVKSAVEIGLTAPGEHMDLLVKDMKYAVRMQLKNPLFTIVAVLAIALGIGANSAMFTIVNSVLLRPLPYPNANQLVMIWENLQRKGGPAQEWTSPANFKDWRSQNQVFGHLTAFTDWAPTLSQDGEPEQLQGGAVTYDTFAMLGVSPEIGRTFSADEDRPGAPNVVVISGGLWKRRFGSDRSVMGRGITLDGQSFTVVGVLPASFKFPLLAGTDVWTSLMSGLPSGCDRGCIVLRTIARMKPGVTLDRAQADMTTIAHRLEQEYPDTEKGVDVAVVSLQDQIVGPASRALMVLFGAVGLVLLIACANVANLLLARATSREKEIAVRLSLGATRRRLVRQLLTESVMLALAGGIIGLALASWTIRVLVALAPQGAPRLDEVSLDSRVLAFTAIVSIATGIIFGLVPAWQTTRQELNHALKEGGRDPRAGASSHRVRSGLVITEVALALMLLIGAGLLFRSLLQLNRVDLGFNPNNLLAVSISLPNSRYEKPGQVRLFYRNLFERVEGIAGVKSASAVSSLPLGGQNSDASFFIEGRPAPAESERPAAWYSAIAPGYFGTMGMQLLKGRDFTESDQDDSARVLIINEAMARRHWPNEDPIGKRISSGSPKNPRWREIVGVVKDVKHFGVDVPARPSIYLPFSQLASPAMVLVVRTASDPASLAAEVRTQVWGLDRNLAVTQTRTMEEIVAGSLAIPRFITLLLALFAGLAVLLAAIGIYGVMAYSVAQRSHEIGVRMALGARRFDVVKLVLSRGMGLTAIGLVIGVAGALSLTSLMRALLFAVSATDPLTFAVVSGSLALVALMATMAPALKATRVDPIAALRCE